MEDKVILDLSESPTPAMDLDFMTGRTSAASDDGSDRQDTEFSSHAIALTSMGDCGHACPVGASLLGDNLPAGVLIDCQKCLENFNLRTDLLLAMFQMTFEEQDTGIIQTSKFEFRANNGAEVFERSANQVQRASKKSIPPPARQPRLRVNGKFVKRLSLEEAMDLASPKTKRRSLSTGTTMQSLMASEGLIDSHPTQPEHEPEVQEKQPSPEESIHVRNGSPDGESPSPYTHSSSDITSRSEPAQLSPRNSPPSTTPDGAELTIHVTNGPNNTRQENSKSALAAPLNLPIHERIIRKRKLSERAMESLDKGESSEEDEEPEINAILAQENLSSPVATGSASITPTTVIRSKARKSSNGHAAHPTSKKRGRPPKLPVFGPPIARKPVGRPRKHPRPGDHPADAHSPTHEASGTDVEGSTRSIATNSSSSASFNYSPTSPLFPSLPTFLGSSPLPAKLPAVLISPAPKIDASTAPVEKKRRGRPPKISIEKSIPVIPVAIKPKPAVEREISSTDGAVHSPLMPTQADSVKKRGRPRKARISLDSAPLTDQTTLPTATTGTNTIREPAPHLTHPPYTVPGSDDSALSPVPEPQPSVVRAVQPKKKGALNNTDLATDAPQAKTHSHPVHRPYINLIVRDTSKVGPKAVIRSTKAPEDSGEDHEKDGPAGTLTWVTPSATSNSTNPVAIATQGDSSPTTTITVAKSTNTAAASASPCPKKPVSSIADAVIDVSTDSESSESTTSSSDEGNSDDDANFQPGSGWASVNKGSSTSTPRPSSRGGSRGRGRGRGNTPGSAGNGGAGMKSRGVPKMEKGQQTLGTFLLKPLAVGARVEQQLATTTPVGERGAQAAGGDGKEKKRLGGGSGKEQNENLDVEMKDA